ncbi:Leader peptidase pppA [Leminorella richardii]|uniref:Leader peptidase pppA n=1 Tax=Leminorella richardii TaxID=158841 RepID=A0A2X4URJ0_9GAMM|nr:A24 family peptidase [Leminorella richardii]SQI42486.1 Leader peptidase pppA [Leminorella richardii]
MKALMDNVFSLLTFGLLGLFIGNLVSRLAHTIPTAINAHQRFWCCLSSSLRALRSPLCCVNNSTLYLLRISLPYRFFHHGRCPRCQRNILFESALVELGCAFLFMALAHGTPYSISLVIILAITASLILLALIDAKHCLLPDIVTLPLLVSGLICAYLDLSPQSFSEAIGGTLFGSALLWLPERLFWYLRREHGLGQGDIKLMAAAGAWLGAHILPLVLLVACLTGMIFFILQRVALRNINRHIPFGPFITFSMWLALLEDPFIINLSIRIQAGL